MRVIIIDDERLARKELANSLSEFSNIEIIEECGNAATASVAIEKKKPDLIFLDIQMPGKNGFELLEELDFVPQVIFVTAYDDYAIKAFEVNALDYLLKPIQQDRLEEAINKLKPVTPQKTNEEKQLGEDDQVFVKDGDKCWFVKLADISMFESEGNYVRVYFENNKPLILKSLNNLAERLDEKYFFRANRKFIINLSWIERIESWFNGGLKVYLKDGKEVEVSRRQSSKLRELRSL